MAEKQWSISIPPLSLTHTQNKGKLCVCEQNGTACLLYYCEQSRQHNSLPFILISILSDKPPSVTLCTPPPPTHPIDPPQNPVRQQQYSFVCPHLPPPVCPLALTWKMLVGGDGGMSRQERQRRGREGTDDWGREQMCRRRGGGPAWVRVLHSFFLFSVFHSCAITVHSALHERDFIYGEEGGGLHHELNNSKL